jgi:small subunit ribosomal protein S7
MAFHNTPTESVLISMKFVNILMKHGKKSKAWKLYTTMLTHLQLTSSHSAQDIVTQAVVQCMPLVEVRKVRVAGTTYFVPGMLAKKKQQALAIRWIVDSARQKSRTSSRPFAQCLAQEITDAFLKQGSARTKRNELHRLAELNRAYSRYRWW